MKRITLLHYASPPTIGGVEATMAAHARGLTALGYRVRVISGAGAPFAPEIETVIDPVFGSRHPDVLAVKRGLDTGQVPPEFTDLVARQTAALQTALADSLTDGVPVIVHNLHTLNKNLPLTCALLNLHLPRVIAWCHDLAWTNEQYQPELHPGYPWDVLRTPQPNTRYVTISEPRQTELAGLLGLPLEAITVVTPGIDPAQLLAWTPTLTRVAAQVGLLDAAGLVLLPARLTRRKNIGFALRTLAALRAQTGDDHRLIVTGPPGPHNPANRSYLDELRDLRAALGLAETAHFVYELDDPPLLLDDDTLAAFIRTADALLFPSTQEGFGIPILEAGLAGLPIFCADLPPFRATGAADVTYFDPTPPDPDAAAAALAAQIAAALRPPGRAALRIRTRQHYRWSALIRERLIPLLEAP